ncbi:MULTISPECIES: hypothetical protein [unclassified Streptomyces]|uniref:hypothetical protein n=1 Tax=unclassified Streptomyces TaxID=2593676 RepID=UPI003826BD4E
MSPDLERLPDHDSQQGERLGDEAEQRLRGGLQAAFGEPEQPGGAGCGEPGERADGERGGGDSQ